MSLYTFKFRQLETSRDSFPSQVYLLHPEAHHGYLSIKATERKLDHPEGAEASPLPAHLLEVYLGPVGLCCSLPQEEVTHYEKIFLD